MLNVMRRSQHLVGVIRDTVGVSIVSSIERNNMNVLLMSQVVATFDLSCVTLKSEDMEDICLRLEIVHDFKVKSNPFSVQVWRKEHYRVSPTFQKKTEVNANVDELILVKDFFFENLLKDVRGENPDETLEQVLDKINEFLDGFIKNGEDVR